MRRFRKPWPASPGSGGSIPPLSAIFPGRLAVGRLTLNQVAVVRIHPGDPSFLGGRLKVGRRTLTPSVEVRPILPQPTHPAGRGVRQPRAPPAYGGIDLLPGGAAVARLTLDQGNPSRATRDDGGMAERQRARLESGGPPKKGGGGSIPPSSATLERSSGSVWPRRRRPRRVKPPTYARGPRAQGNSRSGRPRWGAARSAHAGDGCEAVLMLLRGAGRRNGSLGRRQVVRQRTLIPPFGGSSPPAPTMIDQRRGDAASTGGRRDGRAVMRWSAEPMPAGRQRGFDSPSLRQG